MGSPHSSHRSRSLLRSRPSPADPLQHGQRLGRARPLTVSGHRSAGHSSYAGLVVRATGTAGPGGRIHSMRTISGAASRIARSTASWRVTDEDGQPSQLPEQPQPDGARVIVDAEQLDVAPVAGQQRPDLLEGGFDAVRQRVGMEAVHQQEAGDQLVFDQDPDQPRGVLPGQLQHPDQAGAVEVG